MSRSQKPRTPEHFPRMRDRAAKRRIWTIVYRQKPPYIYCGPIRWVRRAYEAMERR